MLIVTVGKRALFFLYVGKNDRFYANKPHGMYGKWVVEDDRVRFLHMPSDKDKLRQIKMVEYPLDLAAGLAEAFAVTKCRRQFG